jgi:hypothetical protein
MRGDIPLCTELLSMRVTILLCAEYSSLRVTSLLYEELFFSARNFSVWNYFSLRRTIPLVRGAIPFCAELLGSAGGQT